MLLSLTAGLGEVESRLTLSRWIVLVELNTESILGFLLEGVGVSRVGPLQNEISPLLLLERLWAPYPSSRFTSRSCMSLWIST